MTPQSCISVTVTTEPRRTSQGECKRCVIHILVVHMLMLIHVKHNHCHSGPPYYTYINKGGSQTMVSRQART